MYSGKHQRTSEKRDSLGRIRKTWFRFSIWTQVATAGKDGCVFVLNVAPSRIVYFFSWRWARPHGSFDWDHEDQSHGIFLGYPMLMRFFFAVSFLNLGPSHIGKHWTRTKTKPGSSRSMQEPKKKIKRTVHPQFGYPIPSHSIPWFISFPAMAM